MGNLPKIAAVVFVSLGIVLAGGFMSAARSENQAVSETGKFHGSGSKMKTHSDNDSLFKKRKHFGKKRKDDTKKDKENDVKSRDEKSKAGQKAGQ